MLSASVAVSNCRRIVLAVLGCVTLFSAPASVEAHGVRMEPEQAQVVRSFFHALCERDGMTALALLAPGAPVIHAAWTADVQGHRVEAISLNRTGSERTMLLYFRDSACLPLDDLQVQGDLVTWQRTLWRDADSARNGEETLRWHSRARVEERQVAELLMAVELPDSGLPPPPLTNRVTGASQTATGGQRLGGLQASPSPLAPPARPPVSITVGPTEAGWPVVLVGLAGLVMLGGLAGRTRTRARHASPISPSNSTLFSVGLCSAVLLGLTSPVQAHGAPVEDVPVLTALHRAWATQNVEAAVALFDPNAVIYVEQNGSTAGEPYAGTSGINALPDGVVVLMGSGPHIDLANTQVSSALFGGAAATKVTWMYKGAAGPFHLPPVTGQDEVIVLQDKIAAFTRRPDHGTLAVRERALRTVIYARATQEAQTSAAAASGGADRRPDTQERGTPRAGQWLTIVGVPLAVVVVLAMVKRPASPN